MVQLETPENTAATFMGLGTIGTWLVYMGASYSGEFKITRLKPIIGRMLPYRNRKGTYILEQK